MVSYKKSFKFENHFNSKKKGRLQFYQLNQLKTFDVF